MNKAEKTALQVKYNNKVTLRPCFISLIQPTLDNKTLYSSGKIINDSKSPYRDFRIMNPQFPHVIEYNISSKTWI